MVLPVCSGRIAAWLGAIARVCWSRYPTHLARLLVALGSVGCAGIGLALRPDVTFLDSEHLLAYAVGVLAVVATLTIAPAAGPAGARAGGFPRFLLRFLS